MAHIVVVGGGYAGTMALGRLRMQLPDAKLTLVEPRARSQARIHLHRVAAGAEAPHVSLEAICARWEVEHLQQRLVRVDEGLVLEDRRLEPDAVLLALGSRMRPAPGPAHVLDDDASARALAERMRPGLRVTVVGGGTTALEVVTALAVRHPRVRLTLWGDLDGPTADRAASRLADLGIERVEGRVVGLDAEHAWSDAKEVAHDLAVWCAGFEPVRIEGLGPVGADGRLALDAFLQWRPGWFVAGDLGCPPVAHRMGCVTALPMGAHAAGNLVRHLEGRPLQPFGFQDVVTCTDLGGGHGMVQVHGRELVFGGRTGGMLKAAILGYVRTVLAAERTVRQPLYRWAQPAPALEVTDGHRS